jgi:hypothetical protein
MPRSSSNTIAPGTPKTEPRSPPSPEGRGPDRTTTTVTRDAPPQRAAIRSNSATLAGEQGQHGCKKSNSVGRELWRAIQIRLPTGHWPGGAPASPGRAACLSHRRNPAATSIAHPAHRGPSGRADLFWRHMRDGLIHKVWSLDLCDLLRHKLRSSLTHLRLEDVHSTGTLISSGGRHHGRRPRPTSLDDTLGNRRGSAREKNRPEDRQTVDRPVGIAIVVLSVRRTRRTGSGRANVVRRARARFRSRLVSRGTGVS